MDLHSFIEKNTSGLRRNGDVWSSDASKTVSYPEEAREWLYELEERSFWFGHRNDCLLELMRALPPADIILDIGGGNGVVTAALRKAGIDSVLLEPGERGIQNAQKRGISPLIHSSFEAAGFKEGALGAVGLFDVLEHLSDEESFLKGIRKKTKTGGRLYVTVPAYGFLWSEEDRRAGHFRRYSLNSLGAVFERNGFRMEFGSYFFSVLPLPVFLIRTLPEKFGIRPKYRSETHRENHALPFFETIRFLLKPELSFLKNKIRIPFGTSCIACAQAV